MDHKENTEAALCLPLHIIDDFVGFFNAYIIRYLRMDRRHASGRPVIMYDQIVTSHNSVKAFNKFRDLPVKLRIDRLSDQGSQSILGNPDTCPHDDKRHDKAHDSIDIEPPDSVNQNGQYGR